MDIKSLKSKEIKDKLGKKKMPKLLKIIFVVIIIAGIGSGAYLLLDRYGIIKTVQLAWQMQSRQATDQKILDQLKKIMVLPDDVQPTMAVISDIEALKTQQPGFFDTAKNGDRLIIYPTQAIIFDAQAGKIVKVGPVQFTGNDQAQPVNFAIYDSLTADPNSDKIGEMETKLKQAFNNAVVTVKERSVKFDYPQTLVVDIAGNNPDIQAIADAIGGVVSPLPAGEKSPEGVAVLVIIGK